jgi:RNA-binding protein YlmH
MNLNKEEQLLCKRLKEQAYNACNKGFDIYTDFLNLNEINLFYSIVPELPTVQYEFWGGYEDAERRVICFYNDDSFHNTNFPVRCIKIEPLNIKFSDKLTHRDFLGAILNLGIERYTIGDILPDEEQTYVFCQEKIASFIIDNLVKIKHTNIQSKIVKFEEIGISQKYQEINGTVSSKRLDAILSLAFQHSRSSLIRLILNKKVYVNSKLVESNSHNLNDNDIVSVRGLGKFRFKDSSKITKKGRYSITILKYL